MNSIIAYLKNINWSSLLIQLSILVMILMAVSWYQQRNAVRGMAPEISGRLLDGQKINLNQYRGKPVLIHFWATWCPVCKMENSSIDSLAKHYSVLSIAAWSGSDAEVAAFMADENLSMPVLTDNEGNWAKRYGVKAVPASFIVDDKGEIRFIVTGYTPQWALQLRLWWLEKQ